MPRSRPMPLVVAVLVAGLCTWGIARAAVDPPVPEPAPKSRFARVDLRSIVGHAPFRDAQLERQREILDRYRGTIESCRQEMDAIAEEWDKLPEHDDIPPQLEDRTEETLGRWTKAVKGLLDDSRKFADDEGKPLRDRLKTLLEDAARRGGYEAVFQLPREEGGATWGEGDPDAEGTQAVVWCRDCDDLTDELAEVVGIPKEAWVEDSAFRRAAVEFRREFDSYAKPPPWEWDVAPEEGDGEEKPE